MARVKSVFAQANVSKTYGENLKGNEFKEENSAKGKNRIAPKKRSSSPNKVKKLSIYLGVN